MKTGKLKLYRCKSDMMSPLSHIGSETIFSMGQICAFYDTEITLLQDFDRHFTKITIKELEQGQDLVNPVLAAARKVIRVNESGEILIPTHNDMWSLKAALDSLEESET